MQLFDNFALDQGNAAGSQPWCMPSLDGAKGGIYLVFPIPERL